jgi:hypothetical protein
MSFCPRSKTTFQFPRDLNSGFRSAAISIRKNATGVSDCSASPGTVQPPSTLSFSSILPTTAGFNID